MSHTVNIRKRVITTTTTTRVTTGSVMGLNKAYLKTVGGVLQLLESLVGLVVVGLCSGSASGPSYITLHNSVIFLLIIASTCLITTFIMFMCCLFDEPTASSLPKLIFDCVYNFFGCIMYAIGALAVMVIIHTDNYGGSRYHELLVAAIFAVLNTVFYLVGGIMSYKKKNAESI